VFVAGRQTSTHYQDFTIYSGGGQPHVLSSKVLSGTQNRGLTGTLAVRPDGGAFAVDDGGDAASNVTIWSSADPTRPEPVSSLGGMITLGDAVESVAFSPDGARRPSMYGVPRRIRRGVALSLHVRRL